MSIESLAPAAKDNHFNLLRLVAACSVIVSHAYALSGGPDRYDPLEGLIGFDLGTAAVIAFFAISGYFISLSFIRRQSNFSFIVARATRIIPGLLVVSLIAAFVVGPMVTTLPLSAYFSERSTWLYALQNVIIIKIMASSLPGVFADNPVQNYVNGSLWTLFYEVACYVGLFVMGVLAFLRPKRFPVVIIAWVPVYVFARYFRPHDFHYFATFSLPFIIGMLVYQYRPLRVLNGWVALGLVLAAGILGFLGRGVEELWSFAVAYAILWLGFARAPALLAYNRIGDFSYGTYIYGFLVGQTLAHAFPDIGVRPLMASSLLIALLCGVFSWFCVERPAIDLRDSLTWERIRALAPARSRHGQHTPRKA